jgi:hypothetical protein
MSFFSTNGGRPTTVGEAVNIALATPVVLPVVSMFALAEAQQKVETA